MGDSRRFHLLAKMAEKHLDKEMRIADIACGKGCLQAAMRQLGFKNIVSWDKRNRTSKNRIGYRYGYFNYNCNEKYDAIVAMHPDEGTDHSILYTVKNRISALVCPCCIKPSALVFNENYKFINWVNHLKKIVIDEGLFLQEDRLKMNGRNLVLIIKPK